MELNGEPCSCNNENGDAGKKSWRNVRGGGKYNRQICQSLGKLNVFWTAVVVIISIILIGYVIIHEQNAIKNKYSVIGKTFVNLPTVTNEDMGPEVIIYGKDSTSLILREYENDGRLRDTINLHYKINGDTVLIYSSGKPFSIYRIKWIDSEKYEALVDSVIIETHVKQGSKYDKTKLK